MLQGMCTLPFERLHTWTRLQQRLGMELRGRKQAECLLTLGLLTNREGKKRERGLGEG